jgi:hypothetical protein
MRESEACHNNIRMLRLETNKRLLLIASRFESGIQHFCPIEASVAAYPLRSASTAISLQGDAHNEPRADGTKYVFVPAWLPNI